MKIVLSFYLLPSACECSLHLLTHCLRAGSSRFYFCRMLCRFALGWYTVYIENEFESMIQSFACSGTKGLFEGQRVLRFAGIASATERKLTLLDSAKLSSRDGYD